jgi:hypothetical protein
VNPVVYDTITIRRMGTVVGILSGAANSFVDSTATGPATYAITCELGAYHPASINVTSTAAPTQLVLADEDSVAVSLNFQFRWYGLYYSTLYVSSNGRLTFGAPSNTGAAAYSGGSSSFVSGPPSFGVWTDLDPSQGGTVTVDNQASYIRITYSGVPHKVLPSATANFTIDLTSAGTAKITGLSQSTFPATDNVIVGGGPGNSVSASPSLDWSSVLPILTPTPVNSNVAEDFPAANLLDITGVIFLPSAGTGSSSFRVIQI